MENDKTMGKLCPQDVCTGCFACKQVCAKGAIHKTEINGFAYPEIDTSACVDCGLCTKVCPVLNTQKFFETKNIENTISYAIWNKDVDERLVSSSGGVFSVLARQILIDGGIVYGAAWDDNMQLRHVGIEDISKLDSLRRSKYVQSNTDGVYREVKTGIKAGRMVLFCGTPCQIAGLQSFLGHKDYPNLLTVGVVCHGVPSQWSFDKYIHEIEEKDKVKVFDCNFRSKEKGWRTGLNLLVYGKNLRDKSIVINKIATGNSYFNAFLKFYFLRESCYNCPFKGGHIECRPDIMLSDSWSLWSSVSMKEVDFGKGVSAVITNTDKGREYLKVCQDDMVMIERPYSEYASNSGLRKARKPLNNEEAFQFLQTNSWKETQAKFFPLKMSDRFPIYTRLLFGENFSIWIKKIIKKIRKR